MTIKPMTQIQTRWKGILFYVWGEEMHRDGETFKESNRRFQNVILQSQTLLKTSKQFGCWDSKRPLRERGGVCVGLTSLWTECNNNHLPHLLLRKQMFLGEDVERDADDDDQISGEIREQYFKSFHSKSEQCLWRLTHIFHFNSVLMCPHM